MIILKNKQSKRIAVYFHKIKKEIIPIIGSDSILFIDKRLNISSSIDFVKNHAHTKFVKKNKKAIYFRLSDTPSILNYDNHYITELIKI